MKYSDNSVHRFVVVAISACVFMASFLFAHVWFSSRAAVVTRTWDGGGLTNNWSEAANWSGDTVPTSSDDVVFDAVSTKNAIVDSSVTVISLTVNAGYTGSISIADGVALTATNATHHGGTFNVGAGTWNVTSQFTLNNGVFNAGSGTILCPNAFTVNGGTFNGGSSTFTPGPSVVFGFVTVNGGSFIATSGTMTVRSIDVLGAASFDHNNGTITMIGSNALFISSSVRTVNNLILNKVDDGGIATSANTTVAGTLTLTDGIINGGTLRAIGPFVANPEFGSLSQGGGGGNIFIDDDGVSTPRPIDFPAGVRLPNLRINDPDIQITSSGSGSVNVDDLQLDAGLFDFDSNNLVIGITPAVHGSPFTINGGTFNITSGNLIMNTAAGLTMNNGTFSMGSGNASFGNVFRINGGVFNASSGTTTISSGLSVDFTQTGGTFNGNGPLDINGNFNLTGGTFNASPGITNFGFQFLHTSGGTFNHNGGTAVFDSSHPSFSMNVTTNAGNELFNNVIFAPTTDNAQIAFNNRTFFIEGSFQILNGRLNEAEFLTIGDVTIGAGADGGNARLLFTGALDQTFTNNGGSNMSGEWRVSKGFGGTVTAATDMLLATNQTLNINNGTLYLADGSDLRVGPLNIAAAGRLLNNSSTSIVLGATLTNNGKVVLLGGGAACPQFDSIFLRSTIDGVPREWNGTGTFLISDADVKDMAGTAGVVVQNGTNGGNGANWTFLASCPISLSIGPNLVSLSPGQGQDFSSIGGVGNHVYSISANNSGATINPTSGLYTAGTNTLVTDTVTVTDELGTTANANVFVYPATVVTNTNDSGPGSLRDAVIASNLAPGVQTISFNIPGVGPYRIDLSTDLPDITDKVILNGTTQPGYSGAPLIEIRGASLSGTIGLNIMGSAPGTMIRGIALNRFGTAIRLNSGGIGANSIKGNYIGVTPDGSPDGNGTGIVIFSGSNTIGGISAEDRNVISRSIGSGIAILQDDFNFVQGNYIGTGPDGVTPMPNFDGITINSSRNFIGFDHEGFGNLIAFNQGRGVVVGATARNVRIIGNQIHSNTGLGIDLEGNGVTPNDSGDTDSGANDRQNFPIVNLATSDGVNTTVQVTFNGVPFSTNEIHFYSSPSCDPSGNGEGAFHLGSQLLTTNAGGNATLNVVLPIATPSGNVVTATATAAYTGFVSTSEFSACRVVSSSAISISGRIVDNAGQAMPNTEVQLAGTQSRATLTNSHGEYSFADVPGGLAFPGGVTYSVTPVRTNYTFDPPVRNINNPTNNQINQDFAASVQRYTIKGKVRRQIASNAFLPFSGVQVTLSGAAGATAITSALGTYQFTNLLPGQYSVTPSRDEWGFTPSSADVTITSSNVTRDFTAFPSTPPLDGRIVFANAGYVGSVNADGTGLNPTLGRGRYSYPHPSGTDFSGPTYDKQVAVSRNGQRIATIGEARAYSWFQQTVPPPGSGVYWAVRESRTYDVASILASDTSFLASYNTTPSSDFRTPAALYSSVEWSPDGTRIAFRSVVCAPFACDPSNITIINSDGSFNSSRATEATLLTWLSDTQIAFKRETSDTIFLDNIGGSESPLFTADPGLKHMVASPDGTKMAMLNCTSTSPVTCSIKVRNLATSAQTTIATGVRDVRPAWSPDGTSVAYVTRPSTQYLIQAVDASDGVPVRTIYQGGDVVPRSIAWAPTDTVATPVGSNVPVIGASVSMTFSGVNSPGVTTITPILPGAAGSVPNGFVVAGHAFEINTTAAYTSPVTVCFTLPSEPAIPAQVFSTLSLMHNENGTLVDRTTSRNFAVRTICGSVETLSPFAIAYAVDNALPSISGLVRDSNRNPMAAVRVSLSGAEERTTTTDEEGVFSFVNLIEGESYSVRPQQIGYVFNEYSKSFIYLTGENTALFTGTAGSFQITGKVTDLNGDPIFGRTVELDGTTISSALTDSNGNYIFSELPADGRFIVRAVSIGTEEFSPPSHEIDALTSDLSGVDFNQPAPIEVNASISGRVTDELGLGLAKVSVTIDLPNGESRQVQTSTFGYYQVDGLPVGYAYTVRVWSKRYTFDIPLRVIDLVDNITDADFVGRSP